MTWTTGNLLPPKKLNEKKDKLPSTQLILELTNTKFGQKCTTVETEICKNSAYCYFNLEHLISQTLKEKYFIEDALMTLKIKALE